MLRKLSVFKAAFIFFCIPYTMIYAQGQFQLDRDKGKAVQGTIGQVKFLKGTAKKFEKSDPNNPIELSQEGIISEGDRVETGRNSFIKFIMNDESVFTLGAQTVFDFSQYKDTGTDRYMLTRLVKGQLRSHFSKGRKGELKVETHDKKSKGAALGIRGTTFLVNAYTTADGQDITQAALLEGKMDVLNKTDGSLIKQLAPAQEYRMIEKGGRSQNKVLKIPEEKMSKLYSEDSNEEEELNPFLDTFSPDSVSALNSKASRGISSEEKFGPPYDEGMPEKSWKKTLQELNHTLKMRNKED